MSEIQTVSFTTQEIDEILKFLGEVPSKYSLDLVNFIRNKATEQLATTDAPAEVQPEA